MDWAFTDSQLGGIAILKYAWIVGLLLMLPPQPSQPQQQPPQPLKSQPPQQIEQQASDPLSLEHEGRAIGIAARNDYALPGQTIVDTDKLDALISKVEKQLYKAPVNAKIGDSGRIVAEQQGFKLNRESFTEQFYSYFYGSGQTSIQAPLTPIYARVDSELLAHIRQKPIGQYTTYYNTGNKNRSHNVALAAKSINNVVLFPGELFSFNRVVGIRTKQKGYMRAPVIVRGELAEDVGGGICQVSSTLFNAADRAGLRIVQRYSHSRHVPYVPSGRDATVSWGGPDFAFENQYNQPILIRAFAGNGMMAVSIYSSDAIEHKPKNVPGISKRLPEEISIETKTEQ
jgi:vancomycin resistance protein YoaR